MDTTDFCKVLLLLHDDTSRAIFVYEDISVSGSYLSLVYLISMILTTTTKIHGGIAYIALSHFLTIHTTFLGHVAAHYRTICVCLHSKVL